VKVKNLRVKKSDFGYYTFVVDGVLKATNLIETFERLRASLSSRSKLMFVLILSRLPLLIFIKPNLASVYLSS